MIDSVGFSVAALRHALLTVTVLTDLDVLPGDDGAVLDGVPPVPVGLPECRRALAGADPESAVGRDRLSCWLHARRWLAGRSHSELAQLARPVGVPADSPRHPGRTGFGSGCSGARSTSGSDSWGSPRAGPTTWSSWPRAR